MESDPSSKNTSLQLEESQLKERLSGLQGEWQGLLSDVTSLKNEQSAAQKSLARLTLENMEVQASIDSLKVQKERLFIEQKHLARRKSRCGKWHGQHGAAA